MDFDRNAIGSLEDVHREWDSLETERAKVENKLRSFDAAGRGGGFGMRGGRGGGAGNDRGNGLSRGGGGDWQRNRPRDANGITNTREPDLHKSYQATREKYRAMSGKWERGLDPATAALEDDPPPQQLEIRGRGGGGGVRGDANGSMAYYQPPVGNDRDRRGGVRERVGAPVQRVLGGATGGMRGDRDAMRGDRTGVRRDRDTLRGERSGVRGDRDGARGQRSGALGGFDRFRNGDAGHGSREHMGGSGGTGGSGEPEAKRPRVTSTIVVAGDDDINGTVGGGTTENGELDRWNADPAPSATQETPAAAAATEASMQVAQDDNLDDDNVDYEPEAEPELEAGGEDSRATAPGAAASSAMEANPEGEQPVEEDEREQQHREGGGRRPAGKIVVVSSGGPRGRAARAGGVAGNGGIRGSLASRLGPPMGRPVRVIPGDGDGGFVPLSERPLPEPSKPELHVAYTDGDTKKRNKRMFGGLVAHLGRARQQLDHDKTMIEQQKSVTEMAATRQEQEKRRRRQMAASAARQERDEELHKRDYINARQQKTLIALHGNAFIANQEQLHGFIFTKALPKLPWSPNEHTDVTQALLADSNKELEARIGERREADDLEFQKIDDSVAQRAAARASRRSGNAPGERQWAGRQDRNANPYGEGNEDRWPTSGAPAGTSESNQEGPAPMSTIDNRAHDDVDAETNGGGGGGVDGSGASYVNPDGHVGVESMAFSERAEQAEEAPREGMEVDDDGDGSGGGGEVGVNGSAETDHGKGQSDSSARGSPYAAVTTNGNSPSREEESNGDGNGVAEEPRAGSGGADGASGGGSDVEGVSYPAEPVAAAADEENATGDGREGGDAPAKERKNKKSKKDSGRSSSSKRKKSSRRSGDK